MNTVDVATIAVAILAFVTAAGAWVTAIRRAAEIEGRHLSDIRADIREIKTDIEWLKKRQEEK
jgi:hypothetical protein